MATGFSWSAGAKESEIKKMGPEEEKRHLLNRDIAVQVVRGGATQTLGRSLNRSGGRARRRRKKLGPQLVQAGRSLVAFLFGLLLVFIHGLLGFLVHKQPLQFCVISTLILAGLTAFGMGVSIGFRANVMVMLPTLFSARVVLFLYVSVVVSGPMKNTVENTERAAASLLCSADLAANQTKELMQRAATPLSSAIDEIRKISRNAYAVAGRVQNFINTLTDSVRHVARTLRNVLHFLVDIGDICNDKMGAPYRKCRDLFAQGRTDCNNLLKEFNFLCEIVDAFLPLCNLARAGELFCIIPSYVAAHLKQRLAEPTVAAFRKMMREFDFNLSSTVSFDVDANASRTLQQVSQQIMADISADLQNFQRLSQLLAYTNFVLLGLSFIGALMYQRRYLRDLHFDNFYISAQFRQLDQQVASEGGASVLPLTRRETQTYVTPLSLRLTQRERRRVLVRMASVFRHLVGGGLIVAMDFLVFWILDQVHHQVEVDVVARAPYQVAVQVNGSGYASDIFRDLVASFNVFQTGNITVISRKCLVEPKEPDHRISFLLGTRTGPEPESGPDLKLVQFWFCRPPAGFLAGYGCGHLSVQRIRSAHQTDRLCFLLSGSGAGEDPVPAPAYPEREAVGGPGPEEVCGPTAGRPGRRRQLDAGAAEAAPRWRPPVLPHLSGLQRGRRAEGSRRLRRLRMLRRFLSDVFPQPGRRVRRLHATSDLPGRQRGGARLQ